MGGCDMGFIGLLRTLEQITRPPRMGHDDDRPLPDYEVNCLHRAPHYVIPTGEDHQCYCARPQGHPLDDFGHRPHICRCGQLWADLPTKSSASNHAGTGAESAPSPTIVQSAPPPTVDGEVPASVRDIQPSPEAGRPNLADKQVRLGQWLKAMARNDRSPEDIVNGFVRLYSLIQPNPDDAMAEWIGWAVPAICTVLHEHRPFQRRPIASEDDGRVYCSDEDGTIERRFDDYQAWLEHVAPLVANNIAPQPK